MAVNGNTWGITEYQQVEVSHTKLENMNAVVIMVIKKVIHTAIIYLLFTLVQARYNKIINPIN